MKRSVVLAIVGLFLCCGLATAELIDNGDGTVTQIRSDGSRLMWLKDANHAFTSGYDDDGIFSWEEAKQWADQLVFAGYDDWRLPVANPVNGVSYDINGGWSAYDGTKDMGFNITSLNSEMSYMYYVELGNLGRYDIYGNRRIGDVFTNPGPFINLNDRYWTQSPYPGPDLAFSFRFLHPAGDGDGVQTATWLQDRAWAVRDMGPSAIVRLRDLATAVLSLNLRTGIENSLDVKLQSAISAIDDLSENNDIAAINSLGAFINAVEAQMGKELSDEEADYLIETANSIIAQIESE